MNTPLLSIIIPTHNRPHLLPRAVQSALEQTFEDIEVIVVDDASTEKAQLPEHPKLRIIHLPTQQGGAAARNVGTEAARGRWITYLDDDDRLLPHMAATSIEALQRTDLPEPIAVISGIEVVNSQGHVTSTRLPPSMRLRGAHFALEELEPGRSYYTKQTLVVERQMMQNIGGWDETFRSRVHSELFLRLNPACSILGLPIVTYQLYSHEGVRVSGNPALRQESFQQLISKHRVLFSAHPKMFANFVYEHALTSLQLGQPRAALLHFLWALQIHPIHTVARLGSPVKRHFYRYALNP
jgi:glycosyltransferase involved in cell wall biosynthesis